MKRILLSIALAVVFFIAIAVFLVITQNPNGNKFAEITIGSANLKVEIADTPVSRSKGLSGREALDENSGMLFVFQNTAIQNFWMKDMKFPIDIIWIKENKVVGMTIGAGVENGPNYTIYTSPEPVDEVLEINVGLSVKMGINIGDPVELIGY